MNSNLFPNAIRDEDFRKIREKSEAPEFIQMNQRTRVAHDDR